MFTTDQQAYREWMALIREEQQLIKARVIAEKAAFDDMEPEDQRFYIANAVAALKEMEKEQAS